MYILLKKYSCSSLCLILMFVTFCSLVWSDPEAKQRQRKAIKPADIVLGGLFPIHKSLNGPCTPLFEEGTVLLEAMIYAVEITNQRKLLPSNLTMGYNIQDTCNSVLSTLTTALEFVDNNRGGKPSGNHTVNNTRRPEKMIAVLGAGNSVISSAVNNIFSIFKVAQIGYASTSRILSNKNRYPTFLRTVPPDSHQGKAIAKIVSHFRWNYVALLASDDIYGRPLAETFRSEANKVGVCLALDVLIPNNPSSQALEKLVNKLKSAKQAEVVLLFTPEREASHILRLAGKQKVLKKVWIGSDSWADMPKIAEENFKVVEGMFGIINQPIPVPGFAEYFFSLKPLKNRRNPWFKEFWGKVFNCSFLGKEPVDATRKESVKWKKCTGKEQMAKKISRTDSVFYRVSYVLDAVFSVVYSVQKICDAENSKYINNTEERKEECLNKVTPSSVLSRIFNVSFDSVTKRKVYFDRHGDSTGRYDILNLQKATKGECNISLVKVGEYDGQSGLLNLRSHAIHWPEGVTSPPNGRCSVECQPGTYKIVQKPICCWDCKPCPPGSISNISSVTSCTACLPGETTNERHTSCVLIPLTFLHWDSAWAWVLIGTVIICVLFGFVTVIIFVRHRNTPVVKAANREISFLLLFSLNADFLIPLSYIGKPTERNCKVQAILFGVGSAFCLATILARINRTVVVFQYSKVRLRSKSKFFKKYLNLFLYNRSHVMLALILTIIELLLCTVWLLSSPPLVSVRRLTANKSIVVCATKSSVGHALSNAFVIFLSLLCTFMAFKSRKLPQNYNEAKFISFAMFVFNFVWLTFIGVFYGTPEGQHNVIINCFAILISNFAILVLIFGPKLYIILLRPGLNHISAFRALTAQYTFRAKRRSSAMTSDLMASSCVLRENKYVQTLQTVDNGSDFPRPSSVSKALKYDDNNTYENIGKEWENSLYLLNNKQNGLVRMKKRYLGKSKIKAMSDSALNNIALNSWYTFNLECNCYESCSKSPASLPEDQRRARACAEALTYDKASNFNPVVFDTDRKEGEIRSRDYNHVTQLVNYHNSLLVKNQGESEV